MNTICIDAKKLIISMLKKSDKCMLNNCCKDFYNIINSNKIIKLEKFVESCSIEQFLYLEDIINRENICKIAAIKGNLEILQWAYNNKYSYDNCNWRLVCKNGHLEILKWAFANNILKTSYCHTTFPSITESPLKFNFPIQQITHIVPNSFICDEAKENNHFEILEWAQKNNFPEKKIEYHNYHNYCNY